MEFNLDKILDSVDNLTPASPSPYFYGGILKKMNRPPGNIWEQWSALISKPALLVAGCVLILVLNLAIVFFSGKQQQSPEQAEVSLDEYEQLISSNSPRFLDFENSTP